ncbi:MAG: thiamine diphosphokinase [Bacteroidota bacterium]
MKALIIANGTLPGKNLLRAIARSSDCIVCADGGSNHARRLGIKPDIILGDLDSITPATRRYFRNVEIMHIPDQYSTDLEKAISYCLMRKITSADIVGATGTRIDHSTGGLGCFKKFRNKILLRFIDTVGIVTDIGRKTILKTKRDEKISLIPLERCEGITTTNLQYPLKNEILELGYREGISNCATASSITITVKKGTLLLYRFHDTNKL